MWSHSVFRDSGVAMMVVGPAGRIGAANPAALTLMCTSSLSGADLADLVAAPDRASLDTFLAALADIPAGRSQALGPVHLVSPDRTDEVQMIGSRTRGEGGFDALIIAVHEMPYGRRHIDLAAALQELVSEAQHARVEAARALDEAAAAQMVAAHAQAEARTCPMTGLPNYTAYKEAAQQLEADARRTGSSVAAVFLDLDDFGMINKTFSWDQGTRTLSAVARVLESECRGHDRVFRYGGEEFVVLLPQTDLAGARIVAERLRAAVESAGIPHLGLPCRPIVTISVGAAAGRGPTLAIADLVNRADGHCTLAKASGRNRVLPAADVAPPGGDVG